MIGNWCDIWKLKYTRQLSNYSNYISQIYNYKIYLRSKLEVQGSKKNTIYSFLQQII